MAKPKGFLARRKMTAPLHHVNQLFLHLPAMGSFVAGQAAAGEQLQRQATLAQAQALHRDTVEIVAQPKESTMIEPLRPEPEPKGQERRRRDGQKKGSRPKAEEPDWGLGEIEPVVNLRL